MLAAALILASLITPRPLAQNEQQSHCVCNYSETGVTRVKYSRNFLKVISSGFGLWGSTKKCKKVHSFEWKYEYSGPGTPSGPPPGPSGASPLTATTGRLQAGMAGLVAGQPRERRFRWMSAESTCAGDLKRPDTSEAPEMLSFIALDGTSFNVSFQPVTGTLRSFLGPGYDPSEYDPAFVDTDLWTGIQATLPMVAFQRPTLTVAIGADPGTPLAGLMNLANPDTKTLALDLGPSAANLQYSVLVSSTYQDEGPRGVIDGITLPVVLDETTAYFATHHPDLSGVTDELGRARIDFPRLTHPSFHGIDLCIAVVVHDPVTGAVVQTSTYVALDLRDLTLCQ